MRSLLKLKQYIRPYVGMLIACLFLAIPLSLIRAAPPAFIKYLGDSYFNVKSPQELLWLPGLIIGLYLVNFVVRFLHYYLLRIVTTRINQQIKNDLVSHLIGLSADRFSNQTVGSLISRVGTDPQYIDGGLSNLNVIIREPLTFLMLFGSAFYYNWRLTLITLAIFPFLAWLFSATGRNLKRYIVRMTEENAKLFATLQETFSGFRVIQVFGLEKYVRKKSREQIQEFARFSLKTAALEEASHPAVELITAIAAGAVIFFGGLQILNKQITPGDFLAFFVAFGLMMDPIRRLNDINIRFNQASAAVNRIFEIFDWKPSIIESNEPLNLKELKHSIEFKKVRFAYPDAPERLILNDLSFTIPKGKVVALVGASGAGKSSLAQLIPRVFDIQGGQILLDGVDIRSYLIKDLRRLIAVVSQDVFLFNDTVEENIRCGRLSASPAEIREAANFAYASEFIERLPHGYQTVIGDRGQKLSGGEKQRLSIARAFLRHAPILVLDEATSSLDSTSEKMVQIALDHLIENKTSLIIAHRLSTIRNADQILVLKNGSIVESGDHQQLLSKNGEYARFYQFADQNESAQALAD